MPKPLHLIVACARNRVIGRDGLLPWSIPEDTAFFHAQTLGHTIIIGRRSLADWPEATAGRDVILLTRHPAHAPPGVHVAANLDAALAHAETLPSDIYICGGQRLYEEALPRADLLHLTLIDAAVPGDTFFPDWRPHFTRELARRESNDATWRYTFLRLAPA